MCVHDLITAVPFPLRPAGLIETLLVVGSGAILGESSDKDELVVVRGFRRLPKWFCGLAFEFALRRFSTDGLLLSVGTLRRVLSLTTRLATVDVLIAAARLAFAL